MITKYGYSTVAFITVAVFILLVISFYINNQYVRSGIIIFSVIFMIFTLNFFRDPERHSNAPANSVVSPADGTVILIKDVSDSVFIGGDAVQVSVFMTPLNVHVNRIPVSGKVTYLEYIKGEYLIASHEKADSKNERSVIGIESPFGKVLFTQVAGFVARRIVYDLEVGRDVVRTDRFGMIKFGSRCDIIVPKGSMISVKEGDKVKAGESIIAELIQ